MSWTLNLPPSWSPRSANSPPPIFKILDLTSLGMQTNYFLVLRRFPAENGG
jgi:hypothetical protein